VAKKNFIKSLVNQRNSIFSKILIPTVAVLVLQAVLVGLVLIFNGTVGSLDNSAKDSLYRNVENRTITLENMMVHTWSNIGNLEGSIDGTASAYMEENGWRAADVFGNSAREEQLLSRISDALIYTMRTSATTGVFVFFVDDQDLHSDAATLTGLYYRDFNPTMNSADYSDIQLEKGPAAIAQTSGIQLSSLWSEKYTVKAANTSTWETLFAPFQAAIENPELATGDLALWSDAHYLEPDSKNDSQLCITYSRPLFFEGELIGIIGVEIQIEHLKNYFPSNDVGEKGGYMLLHYSADKSVGGSLNCSVSTVTGSYIKRLADFGSALQLTHNDASNIYQAFSPSFEPASVAVQTMKLYNSNAPFSDRQWALAAALPDSVLFENSTRINRDILSSSAIALVLGFIFLLITIRMATKPILSIATQIEHGNADDLVVVKSSKTYEINLLCDTINEMKRKRKDIEIALREEGERYLLALESAIDIFIEYDLENDSLRIYFFIEEGQNQLTSQVVENFMDQIGGVCHPSDVGEFTSILMGRRTEPCEMRIRTDMFPHEKNKICDGEYFWFSFTAVQIRSEERNLEKIIGSAKHITAEKLREFAIIEAARRDITTGAYNREYGRLIVSGHTENNVENGDCLLAIVVGNFEKVEAYYGRLFGAAVLREISSCILTLSPKIHSLIRWGNAEFIAFCALPELEGLKNDLSQIYDSIYIGENDEITVAINLGIGEYRTDGDEEDCLNCALAAAHSCGDSGVNFAFANIGAAAVVPKQSPPLEFGVEISAESIVGFTLNLFEHVSDIRSVMNMLLRILGGIFKLDRIIICEYDEDFGSNRINYQWASVGTPEYRSDIERISHAEFTEFASRLDDSGLLEYDSASAQEFSAGVQQLLCICDDEFTALCSEMYENGLHAGRAIFVSLDKDHRPSESAIFSVYEVAKIISTRLNLEKSNSASRAKSEFLSKMSHEIRTPMNAIIGLTRMAKDAGQDTAAVRNSLEKIDLSAKHLLSLINDILDMSRIESGKLSVEKRQFVLPAMVSNIDTLMCPQFEEKGVNFAISAGVSRANVIGDEQKLRQVIINLLSNACKFTPAGGMVELSIAQRFEGDICKCVFSVKDSGVGISKEDQFNIFSAFEQSVSSNLDAGNPQGTGLGLAISNSLVSAMGGRIELKSERGKGSEFYFTLEFDCGEESAETAAEAAGVPSAERFKGRRALLVDDNEINLEIAAYLLEDIGFICDIAKDGKEAVDKFFGSEPGYYDVIFMDINMPVMDGFTATREIRKRVGRSDSRRVPIIAMTANAFSEDTKKSIEAGMNAHVAKPIDVDFLYSTLDSLFMTGDSG